MDVASARLLSSYVLHILIGCTHSYAQMEVVGQEKEVHGPACRFIARYW
jgi:hypothetical protein